MKKGFTLIELLAVIVILAIIALIATPIVLNIIKDSRESVGLRSAEMYLKGVETSLATATINNKKVKDGTYPITPDGDICLVKLTSNTCSKDNTLAVEMNGEKPESGSITVLNGKVIDIALTYSNKKTIVKDESGKLVYGGSENGTEEVVLPTGWKVTEKPETWTSTKVTAITDNTNTIPLPQGFELSKVSEEQTVDGGLVIKDRLNEFVWVPVSNAASYTEDSFGPLIDTDSTSTHVYDSQEELNYYYGMKEDEITPYYNYSDFTYETDKTNIERSIKTYGGFYVGRYETTIDGNTIGVQKGKTILTAEELLKEGLNSTSNDEYHYRWWGLYKVQKDMYAHNEVVGSTMISSKQWDEILSFTGYGSGYRETTETYATRPDLSGSAYANDSTKYDVINNIYDLAGNVSELTLKSNGTSVRVFRGGRNTRGCPYTASYVGSYSSPSSSNASDGSRVTLFFR